jgi:hypothetical protein
LNYIFTEEEVELAAKAKPTLANAHDGTDPSEMQLVSPVGCFLQVGHPLV